MKKVDFCNGLLNPKKSREWTKKLITVEAALSEGLTLVGAHMRGKAITEKNLKRNSSSSRVSECL